MHGAEVASRDVEEEWREVLSSRGRTLFSQESREVDVRDGDEGGESKLEIPGSGDIEGMEDRLQVGEKEIVGSLRHSE